MKVLILVLCAFALSANAEPDAAAQAEREKARADIQAHRDAIKAEMNARRSTATTTNNTNGTFTVSGPIASDDLPDCKSVSLTFTEPVIGGNTNGAVRARRQDCNGRRRLFRSGTGNKP